MCSQRYFSVLGPPGYMSLGESHIVEQVSTRAYQDVAIKALYTFNTATMLFVSLGLTSGDAFYFEYNVALGCALSIAG